MMMSLVTLKYMRSSMTQERISSGRHESADKAHVPILFLPLYLLFRCVVGLISGGHGTKDFNDVTHDVYQTVKVSLRLKKIVCVSVDSSISTSSELLQATSLRPLKRVHGRDRQDEIQAGRVFRNL